MARAYIVLARNDLDANLLQVLDLFPNPTPSKGSRIYDGPPQGGYQTFYLFDGITGGVTTQAGAGGGASLDVDGDTYGLAAYLIDRVEDTGGNESLTAAEANAIGDAIAARVANGQSLTLADINVLINNPAGVAGSDLDGTLGNSTGTVEEVLRILAGERFKIPDNSQVRAAAGTFDATQRGFFVARPNVETPDSIRTTHTNARGLRGRRFSDPLSHIRPGEPRAGNTPLQTGQQDTRFQDVRQNVDTGHLHLSATDGHLAELKAATFTFQNPAFTYGGGATPATTIDTTVNIAATGATAFQARGVVVYDAAGNVI